jgi:hypothetical protein
MDSGKLHITNTKDSFYVDRKMSIALELELNKSPHGRPWITVGDHLFEFGTGKRADALIVTYEQFTYLNEVFAKLS